MSTTMTRKPRWLIRRDLPEVLDIEQQTFPEPWDEKMFLDYLRLRNCIGMVVEDGNKVVGFMIYLLEKDHLIVANMAVHPDYRRQGYGSSLIQRLQHKVITHASRERFEIHVMDDNLPMHLFLRSQEVRCESVDRGYYDDGKDGYLFVWRDWV